MGVKNGPQVILSRHFRATLSMKTKAEPGLFRFVSRGDAVVL